MKKSDLHKLILACITVLLMLLIIIISIVICLHIIELTKINHELIILITIIISLVFSVSVTLKISNFVK